MNNLFNGLLCTFCVFICCNAQCRNYPLKKEVTAFKTVRFFCEYEHFDKVMGTVKMRFRPGSKFQSLDSCQRCSCTGNGLQCCRSGIKSDVPRATIPQECHVVKDGCDEYIVYKSDNFTDCATGKPSNVVRKEIILEQKRKRFIGEMVSKAFLRAAGIGQTKNDGNEVELQFLPQLIMMDYLLGSEDPSGTGSAEGKVDSGRNPSHLKKPGIIGKSFLNNIPKYRTPPSIYNQGGMEDLMPGLFLMSLYN